MFDSYRIDFENRWYLLLLAIVPLIWWWGRQSLAALGRVRRYVALALRSLLLMLLVFALAEMQWVRVTDRLTVLFVVDQSLSIAPEQEAAMVDYVNASIGKQRDAKVQDRAGVIVFGRDAAIEIPPLDDTPPLPAIESLVDREYTNAASALKLAQASFPHDTAKRVVLLSDGNENVGDALAQARNLADSGIGIDTVPIRSEAHGEVAVEKVALPPDVRRGDPFNLRVVLNNTSPPGGGDIKGRLKVLRRTGDHEQTLSDQPVALGPGKHVFTVPEEIKQPDFYTYDARFIPDNPNDDKQPQNNRATAFTHVQGSGQVLFLENDDPDFKGEYDLLVERLKAMNIEVILRDTRPEELFTDLSQLQPFDAVILGDVPREKLSEAQVQMLVRNTQNMGAGLVMLGGPNSFGAGGWTNSPLEEAMPVDFQIKSAKVVPTGALVMLMHATELAQGNHWQKVISREAIKTLGYQDYCGVLHWGDMRGGVEWLWRGQQGMLKVGPNRTAMLSFVDRMTPGDMPEFDSSLKLALAAFNGLPDAAVKHMIIISDGDPSPPSNRSIAAIKALGAKISTVAIGTHGPPGSTPLQSIANATGGKYYVVTNPAMLPRIYQKEARRIARPLIYEKKDGFRPKVESQHEMLQGFFDGPLPPLTGYVMTTKKDNPLAEISVVSPEPAGGENNTVLASWTYGLGKAVAFTTDAGKRWATAWTGWDGFDKFFSQLVRWSMRPVGDTGKLSVATDVQDGKVRVVVTALDKDDEFLNFLKMSGTVVGPDMKPVSLDIKQTAPGHYVGEFEAKDKGTYFLMVSPGPGRAPIRAGVSIPYSDEFRDRGTNEALLKTLANLSPSKGVTGKVLDAHSSAEAPSAEDKAKWISGLLATNPFRHDLPKASTSQSVWHLLLFVAGCVLLADVFVRRVTISFAWAPALAAKAFDLIMNRESIPVLSPTMERLRGRKAEVTGQIEQKRAAARFEPTQPAADLPSLEEQLRAQSRPTQPAAPPPTAPAKTDKKEEESYTDRLLKAKKKVWEERKKDGGANST